MLQLNLFGDSQTIRFNRYIVRSSSHTGVRVGNVVAKSVITISQLKALIKEREPVFHSGSINVVFYCD